MSTSERIYAILLTMLYPRVFLRKYREPLEQAFRDQLHATAARHQGLAGLWLRTLVDLLRSATAEHWSHMTSTTPLAYLLFLAAMLFLGRLELQSDDTGVIVFLTLGATFVLGCMHPRRALLWALTGLCIPAAEMMLGSTRIKGFYWIPVFITCVGLAGSYSGVLVRKMLAR